MASSQEQATAKNGEGTKELAILVGILMVVVGGTAGTIWMTSDSRDAGRAASAATVVAAAEPAAVSGATAAQPRPRAAAPAPAERSVVHADVYFDFKSTRLRADAVRTLQEQVALMDEAGAWTVLVQGHADHHGPAEYNRVLAQRRAEVVKRFLVELGVAEASIKAITIGQDGALCDDLGPECQQLNRRVHIETRRLPGAVAAPVRPAIAHDDVVETESAATGFPASAPVQ